ncbi:mannose-1-phosphate guanylyltransferase [Paenibacillaceae bacterium GAS479]|nr:mannose-1-phosphate guanylyltransferase [Paenibacillaceae bacterium GAS479]
MKLVLLSGGSGKRLWPLSNDARSKQFLKILENEKNERVSMVQRVWGQLEKSGLSQNSYIATSSSQIEIMQSQVGADVPLIVEPERRDTFPAIALAASYLYSTEKVDSDEIVCILPVDPYVEDHFFNTINSLGAVLERSKAEIALIGVSPVYPSSKYGYIIPLPDGNSPEVYRRVSHFQEKPSEAQASELIANKALWNCGVFAFKLAHLLHLIESKGFPTDYEALTARYNELPKISFDYEVIEKSSNIVVVPYDGYWKDLGTWNTLTEEMKQNQIGKGIISEDCINTHLINEIDLPISIIGLSDVVVAVSPDGILVTDKSASPRVKDFVDYSQGPMYEERQWGWLRVLDDQSYEDGRTVATKRVGISAGKNPGYRMHLYREEVWTVVKGSGEFIQNGNYMKVGPGNTLHIPMKTLHSIRALSDVEIIVVQSGHSQNENQIIEIFKSWDEIIQNCLNAQLD